MWFNIVESNETKLRIVIRKNVNNKLRKLEIIA